MATAKTRRKWPRFVLAACAARALAGVLFHEPLAAFARTGAAFGARTACSCRYIAGRSLSDCKKDFEPGMAAVFVSDDPDTRTVTARVPLIASDRAALNAEFTRILGSRHRVIRRSSPWWAPFR